MNTAKPIEGDVLDSMPVAQPQKSTAVAVTANPFQPMAMMAIERGAMDQLEKLLDLQMKWDAEQQRKDFVAAMSAFKAQPIRIVKGKLVEFETRDGDMTSYRHATLADVVDAVVRGMGQHGLSHRWAVAQDAGKVTVTCTITHRGGHSESVTMSSAPDASGKKNAIQQVASAVTYLQRYTLMAATGVAAADMAEDDSRGYGHAAEADIECISEEQAKILEDLISNYVANKEKFLDWVRGATKDVEIKVLADIQAKHFDLVHAQLGRIRGQKEQARA
ncbi:hypothetical protein NB710_001173 [Xanthomonas sacchari]|nr:hypothetical protein [Xanthomonas sacchari]